MYAHASTYLGSKLGWMLRVPSAGMSKKACGRMLPYAAVMHKSGCSCRRASRKAGSLQQTQQQSQDVAGRCSTATIAAAAAAVAAKACKRPSIRIIISNSK
eukprot:scaffold35490_cov22-Tisochrysis_lutea.AAC.1